MKIKAKREEKQHIIHSGWGSIKQIRKHESKGIFFSENPDTGEWVLIDNINKPSKDIQFNSYADLEKYIKEHY